MQVFQYFVQRPIITPCIFHANKKSLLLISLKELTDRLHIVFDNKGVLPLKICYTNIQCFIADIDTCNCLILHNFVMKVK